MKDKSSEDIQKKLLQKINEAADVISKSTSKPANWVVYSGADLPSFMTEDDKRRIMLVKQWLKQKKQKKVNFELHAYHSIDAEAELTAMLTEEINKTVKEKYEKQKATRANRS